VPRVVVDPGVLVAALISRTGAPARLLRHWLDGALDLLVSPALLSELERVLARTKFERHFTQREAAAFVALLRERGVEVGDPGEVEARTRDAADDYLIALAESAAADVLVSGDRDLTEFVASPVPVLTPRTLLDRLEGSS
jgi:putative PIN family toxin of toxin-antitoxin system